MLSFLPSLAIAATRISCATGNFTTAGTWCTADAASILDSEALTASCTTSYAYTSTFIPAANAIDAVLVKASGRATSPSGTVSIELYNNTTTTSIFTVTINATDIPAFGAGSLQGGWYAFKNGSTHTPNGTDSYKIGFKCQNTSSLSLYRYATASNWSRLLRTTGTGAPAANDLLVIAGELTGAGTGNDITVTMDNTATTSFGTTTPPSSLSVNKRGTLTWGTASSTAYYLKWKGTFAIYAGGTMNVGTNGAAIPASSSAVLEMDSAANVDTGLYVYSLGTLNVYGNPISYVSTKLTANASNGDTSITTADTTGWKNGDVLAIASTTRVAADTESKALTGDCSGTSCAITALATANTSNQCPTAGSRNHCGESPVQAEVINLTRNVKIRGISTTLQGWINTNATSSSTLRYAEIYQLGSANSGKRGIDVNTTAAGSGTFDIQYCSLHDFRVASSVGVYAPSGVNGLTYSYNVSYNHAASHVNISGQTSGTFTVDHNIGMITTDSASYGFAFSDHSTITNNTFVGGPTSGVGILFADWSFSTPTISNNTAHSCAGVGMRLGGPTTGEYSSLTTWRNVTAGVQFTGQPMNLTLSNLTSWGNPYNVECNSAYDVILTGADLASETGFTGSNLGEPNGQSHCFITFVDSSFDQASGLKIAAVNEITFGSGGFAGNVGFINTLLAPSTAVVASTFQARLTPTSSFWFDKYNRTAGDHRSYKMGGVATIDASLGKTAMPSEKLTPNSASVKMWSGKKTAAVASGGTVTPTVYVYKSGSYNGNQPRLLVRANLSAGIATDTVLATASGGTGSWLTLSGATASVSEDTVLEFYVDCDGTAGTVNVDDWSVL